MRAKKIEIIKIELSEKELKKLMKDSFIQGFTMDSMYQHPRETNMNIYLDRKIRRLFRKLTKEIK